jgi:Fe-Mn family superoxide dismutase
MAFTLPDLPYAHDALAAKGMSRETLEFHHDLHHKAYVDNGNKLIAGTEWESRSLEEIVAGTYQPGAVAQSGVFNNASQHWNHNQFWTWMTPERQPHARRGRARHHRSLRLGPGLQDPVPDPRGRPVRLGWVWLVRDADGSLKITKTENGVNPLCFGQTALLGCDVWEHSYYIDFRNKRPGYLQNFLDNLVDWENVASRM